MNKKVTYFNKDFELYISEAEIRETVKVLAEKINNDYGHYKDEDICIVSILSGSFVFVADLIRRLHFEFKVDFVKIRSYEGLESEGTIEHILELSESAAGKHILVIEDIVDTGLTIASFIEKIKKQNPRSLRTCALLSKPDVHNDIIPLDDMGREIPPDFVIGYGLDINGMGRGLRDIYKLVT